VRKTLGLMLCLAALPACQSGTGNEAGTAPGNGTENARKAEASRAALGEALAQSGDHSSFVAALESAGLAETLRGAGPYTLLAPTNAAFAALPEDARAQLMQPANRARLTALLSYHIVPGTVTVEDLRRAIDRGQGGRAELATLSGETVALSRDGDAIVIADAAGGRARMVGAEAIQANGVIHGVDAVLMPGGE
jgi:uncharacterized surface protein with fasciclin (FAS1) repeats